MEEENYISMIESAYERIAPHILCTPLMRSGFLSQMIGGNVFLKLENEQHTGSFKARGSLNKVLTLGEQKITEGLITASTGNHGLGFARALEIAGSKGSIYVPVEASKAKLAALSEFAAEVVLVEGDSLYTEIYAKEEADRGGYPWVSPYNDLDVIAGQGTIGLEIDRQAKDIDHVLITVGGGGLIAGIGSYIKNVRPNTRIVACQPENSPEMTLSLKAGKIVNFEYAKTTLSDGSAGGIEEGSITFPICQKVVDHCVLATESEIKSAVKIVAYKHKKIIEGSAGVAVASLIKEKDRYMGQNVVIVICGGNIDMELFRTII